MHRNVHTHVDAMNTPKSPNSQLSSVSEYALILGAGAGAAMSIAAQQVAVASLPVSALVAIGLVNRHRLDQQVKEDESVGSIVAIAPKQEMLTNQQVTSQPTPESISVQPQAAVQQGFAARFARRRNHFPESFIDIQKASLKQIGAHLQQVRQAKGLSLHDIHEQTFIQTCMLRAIEGGDLRSLPEPFYIRAFIIKYASLLGLKGTEVAADFPMSQT